MNYLCYVCVLSVLGLSKGVPQLLQPSPVLNATTPVLNATTPVLNATTPVLNVITPVLNVATPAFNATDTLNKYGYENIGTKYALVVRWPHSWQNAKKACEKHLNGATLFVVNNAEDSSYLGKKLNQQKEFVDGSSKFWVGLTYLLPTGPLQWTDGTPYKTYPEVVQADGYNSEKNVAYAVPSGLDKIKYEFLTATDEAEAFVCQYVPQ